ncbi:uncharacterized protein PRCAT00004894001 [Priceomyces carsonii]|uniref:uncharacterized protein n=1 Tax=Priceomyces carsonii TaxID=28549 RepID=UPI002EDA863A|nr:unnamed protein product [Priceomyces carsonii]
MLNYWLPIFCSGNNKPFPHLVIRAVPKRPECQTFEFNSNHFSRDRRRSIRVASIELRDTCRCIRNKICKFYSFFAVTMTSGMLGNFRRIDILLWKIDIDNEGTKTSYVP